MTDAEKREKVIRGLEVCNQYRFFGRDCYGCPYYGEEFSVCNIQDMLDDALSLLKEQEPRVLEYSEIEKHPLVWLEENDKEDVIPALFLQYNGWNAEFSVQAPDEYVESIVRAATVIAFEKTYNVMWRAWTSRPTPEQMRDTKWEVTENG